MPFIVVYDAEALFPNAQRGLLIRMAIHDMVQAKWTDQILDEMVWARARKHQDATPEKLSRLRTLMNDAIPDCLVTGYEPLIEGLKLPDPDDRHVLAAAIRAGAQVIVTTNLRDFPPADLEPWNVEAKSPDDFVLDQITIDDRIVFTCVQEIANSRKRHPQTASDVLGELARSGLVESVAALRSPPS